jgi:Ca2+-transporting ATPase
MDTVAGRGDAAHASAATMDRPQNRGPVTPLHTVVPGRARLAVAGLRRRDDVARAIVGRLLREPGVSRVAASPVTGNVLVLYGAPLDLPRLMRVLEAVVPHPAAPAKPPAPVGAAVRPTAAGGKAPVRPPESRAGDRPDTGPAWHGLEAGEVVSVVGASVAHGLTTDEAADRRRRLGANALPRLPRRTQLAMLAEQFASLPVVLLTASAVLSVATGGVADAVAILGVVAVNAAIGFATEREAERTISAMIEPAVTTARVLRDGRPQIVPIEDVVVGDVQLLEPGTFVAADARIVEARDLTVDESLLTGESMPVAKAAERLRQVAIPLGDRCNMVYRGTALTGGSGLAVVVATGADTEIGRIQAMVGQSTPPPTPMQAQLDRIGGHLVWLSCGICALVGAVGVARGQGVLPMLRSAISLAVAAVPEGLPTIATTTLALGVRSMRRHHVLIRRLDAVETLGAVQVICFDKTGTLTLNRISAIALSCDGREVRRDGSRWLDRGETVDLAALPTLSELLRVAVLCNECAVVDTAGGVTFNGSPTEAALVRLAVDAGIDVRDLRDRHPTLSTGYRTEQRSYMETLHACGDGALLIAVKGSPEAVLGLCRWTASDGRRRALSEQDRLAITAANERMGGAALRVLGFASAAPSGDDDAEPGDTPLTWLGLVGMADPVRDGMDDLMRTLRGAGVETVMITGDQSATAYAVARQLGLGRSGRIEILESGQLEDLAPDMLAALAPHADVFARVSPRHKLQIVQALQRGGEVVAMTGDGINDSPALKAADIGVAMGHAGTDVAREVADVVLENDDPATFAIAIAEGRTIYNNVRRSLRFLLATNMSEIVVMTAGTAAGLGQTLTPMQLLWINLVTDVFPALALAVEPAHDDVMREQPRPPSEAVLRQGDFRRILGEGAVISAAALAACAWGVRRYGPGPSTSTMTLLSMVGAQLMHAVTCRSDRRGLFSGRRLPPNRWLERALLGTLALQVVAVAAPPLCRMLGLGPLTPADWAVTAGCGIAPYLINEALKLRTAPPEAADTAAAAAGDDPQGGQA